MNANRKEYITVKVNLDPIVAPLVRSKRLVNFPVFSHFPAHNHPVFVSGGARTQSNSHPILRMELFEKARVIRLRSHHDKYLLADDDQEGVSQDRNGISRNARWTVEIVEGYQAIRLQSCYSKYLTASSTPFLLGMTGKKVIQTSPSRLDSSLDWEPIREGVQVRLKTRHGQYLRANGGVPPWRNHVTHDIPHRTATQDWILWDVDILDYIKPPQHSPGKHGGRSFKASLHPPPPLSSSSTTTEPNLTRRREPECDDSFVMPAKNEGRVIKYVVANKKGEVEEDDQGSSFTFKGSVVDELKERLEEETGMNDILVCSQNPFNGMLNPLTLHLPPNKANMHVVVVPFAGKDAKNILRPASPPSD